MHALLHDATCTDPDAALDDPTWRDLLLDRYLDVLGPATSLFGRQALYRRLRAGGPADARTRVTALLDDPARRAALEKSLAPLGEAQEDVATLLFHERATQPAAPPWLRWVPLLPVLLALGIACALLVSPLGWIAVALALYWLMALQLSHHDRVGEWHGVLLSLHMLLRASVLLDGPDAREAARLGRAVAPVLFAYDPTGIGEYGKWFFATNVLRYYRTVALVWRERAFLRGCYLDCAELEADVTLARYLSATPGWCWATPSEPRALALNDATHPLLDAACGLSIGIDGRGVFLSGQNGVGKSTFLRTLGLSVATARAFGFCHARTASVPAVPVVASLRNDDSLLDGQSLYVAELARARELLAAARARPVLCLIDEIFRGTNHEEAVAAAAAVLDELAERALVVVSSHNLVLAPLLAHRLDAWRIVRGDAGLRLEPGLLAQTNGVTLLAAHGFGSEIEAKAARVADWLAGQVVRLAREGAGAEVLSAAPAAALPTD